MSNQNRLNYLKKGKIGGRLRGSKFINIVGSMAGLFGLMILFALTSDVFLTTSNLLTITLQVANYAILACGVSFVLIIGGAELSIGSILGLSGVICALSIKSGIPVEAAILLALGTGILCGVFNGLLVTRLHLIPFIATLGTQYMFRGFTQILSNGTSISIREVASDRGLKILEFIGAGKLLGFIPMPTVIMLIFAAILSVVLAMTTLGRKIFATGSNVEAARLSGINVNRITTIAYAFSGGMAGLAGVVLTSRLLSAQPAAGTGYELEGIAAAVIGGVSMMGGQGSIPGAVLGALIIGVMRNGLNLLGINSFWQMVVMGGIIIVAVYFDLMRRRREMSEK